LEGRPLRKREKDAIKEDVLIDLLPHAFPKSAITHIFINTNSNLIYVDSSTPKKAEDALALLRKTIGSLPVIPVIPNEPIDYTLTHWLKDDATPSGFTFSDSVKFESVMDNGGIATFRSQDLASDEIKACLDAEKVVVEAVLNWQDRLDFKLTSAGALKALKFSSELRDQNDDIPREDAAARIDADFILACGELEAFFSALYTSLGGVENLTLKEQSEVETSSAGIESVSITSGSTTIKLTRDDVQKLKKVARELDGELDSLFAEARKHVAETRRASVANLQRKFKIGYNRAALIMEQLEITGCVSAHQSNGGREVLIAPQEAK
jgi:recombination associated protein RdgC